MKNKRGFTLIELVIVIIIIAILVILSVAIYRKYINKAKMTEGKALLDNIINVEEIYYSANDEYFASGAWNDSIASSETNTDKQYNINTQNNKYFRSFKITGGESSVVIQTRDTEGKITMQVILSASASPVFSVLSGD